jgi:hypothetical protein
MNKILIILAFLGMSCVSPVEPAIEDPVVGSDSLTYKIEIVEDTVLLIPSRPAGVRDLTAWSIQYTNGYSFISWLWRNDDIVYRVNVNVRDTVRFEYRERYPWENDSLYIYFQIDTLDVTRTFYWD